MFWAGLGFVLVFRVGGTRVSSSFDEDRALRFLSAHLAKYLDRGGGVNEF